jgi:hypothetical protein
LPHTGDNSVAVVERELVLAGAGIALHAHEPVPARRIRELAEPELSAVVLLAAAVRAIAVRVDDGRRTVRHIEVEVRNAVVLGVHRDPELAAAVADQELVHGRDVTAGQGADGTVLEIVPGADL